MIVAQSPRDLEVLGSVLGITNYIRGFHAALISFASCCSTAVKRTPSNQEVMGSITAGYIFFSFLSFSIFLHQWSVLKPLVGASLTVCCESNKNRCLALLPVAKKSQ